MTVRPFKAVVLGLACILVGQVLRGTVGSGALIGGGAALLATAVWGVMRRYLTQRRQDDPEPPATRGTQVDWHDAAGVYYKRTWAHDGRLSVLPAEWQRELVALMLVDQEVNNGAYLQFFANHGREIYEYASRALKAIRARRMAEIIDTCQALIDEHSPNAGQTSHDRTALLPNEIIGRDGRTVKERGSVLPDWVLDRVSELSYEFMSYSEDVGELAQAHYGPLIEQDKPTE